MESVEYDFGKICRVCKSEAALMLYLFVSEGSDNGGPRIDEMLMACSSVEVNFDDGLPQVICRDCSDQLTSLYRFKQLCESTDATLREYLRAAKDNSNVKVEYSIQSSQLDVDDKVESIPVPVTEHDITYITEELESEVECGAMNNIKPDPDDQDVVLSSIDDDFIRFLENSQLILTCRTCSKCFTTLDGLKCHKRLHSGSLFKCKQCGKQYTRQNHLQRHELLHGPRKVHVCKICNKTLTRFEHLKRHLITHLKEKPFACTKCNRGFTRSEHLMNHTQKCKGDRVHICDICNKGFNREDSLAVHRHLHDNKKPILPTLDNLDNIDEHYLEIEYAEPNEPSTYSDSSPSDAEQEAPECLEPLVNIADSNDHVKLADIKDVPNIEAETELYGELDPEELLEAKSKIVAEMLECNDQYDMMKQEREDSDSGHSEYLPTKSITRVKRKRGRPRKSFSPKSGRPRGRPSLPKVKAEIFDDNSDMEGEFGCPNCDKVFNKMSLLEKHAEKHDGLKIHSCTVCNKSFTRGNHLKRHMLCHLEEKPYSCDICTKRFNRRDHLLQHMKLHTRAQEFECEICKRLFGRSDQLTKHMSTKHSLGEKVATEKKFQCAVCLKAFTTEKYRDVHMKGHMGDKKYQCRTCDKSFLSKSHLTEHIKFHNENSKKFLCSECGQRFIRNDYLVIHMRRHRGEKPFKCKYCGKGFPRTTDLTVHERYHTGEKTHLCTVCGRGFGRAYNLTVHMRTHTGEKPYQCTYCDAAFAQGNDLKAHVRRHTGERFHCDLCSESFLMGYLLTQHKRSVHGLNVVSHIRRLQPVSLNREQQTDFEPITIPLPPPVVSIATFNNHIKQDLDDIDDPSAITEVLPNAVSTTGFDPQIQTQLAVAQLHQMPPL